MKATKALPEITSMADAWRGKAIDCAAKTETSTEKGRRPLSDYHQVLLEGMNLQPESPLTYLRKQM